MKKRICDVCYYKENSKKWVQSEFTLRYKKNGLTLSLDACKEHQNFLREAGTFEKAQERYNNLLKGVYESRV